MRVILLREAQDAPGSLGIESLIEPGDRFSAVAVFGIVYQRLHRDARVPDDPLARHTPGDAFDIRTLRPVRLHALKIAVRCGFAKPDPCRGKSSPDAPTSAAGPKHASPYRERRKLVRPCGRCRPACVMQLGCAPRGRFGRRRKL